MPDSTVSKVRPSSSTLMSQSVPRIAAVAAGVSRFSREPSARRVCVQARPALSSSVVTGWAGVATPLTCSTVFWCRRSWVSSANSRAIRAACRVRTKSPVARAWAGRAGCQSAAAAARWSPVPCRLTISAAAPAGTAAWASSGQARAVNVASAVSAGRQCFLWDMSWAFGEGWRGTTWRSLPGARRAEIMASPPPQPASCETPHGCIFMKKATFRSTALPAAGLAQPCTAPSYRRGAGAVLQIGNPRLH
ncbi:hypothetical protein D3C71_1065850 [compost metagenome]